MRTDTQAETRTMKKIRKWYKKELQSQAIADIDRAWAQIVDDLRSRHGIMRKLFILSSAALLIENVILIIIMLVK